MTTWGWIYVVVQGGLSGFGLATILNRWIIPPLERFRARMLADLDRPRDQG